MKMSKNWYPTHFNVRNKQTSRHVVGTVGTTTNQPQMYHKNHCIKMEWVGSRWSGWAHVYVHKYAHTHVLHVHMYNVWTYTCTLCTHVQLQHER